MNDNCFSCGEKLHYMFADDMITQIGWTCRKCNESWTYEQHKTNGQTIAMLYGKINELIAVVQAQQVEMNELKARIEVLEGKNETQ